MKTVFRVVASVGRFQYFFTEESRFLDETLSEFHAAPFRDEWRAPSVFIFNPRASEGHFLGFVSNVIFAVAETTVRKFRELSSFFEQGGELLPFKHQGRDFFIFNCTNCIDALDEGRSKFSPSRQIIERYAFRPNRFNFSLFTVPQSREMYCVTGDVDPCDEFKGFVEANKLTGLMFEELWSEQKPKRKPTKKK